MIATIVTTTTVSTVAVYTLGGSLALVGIAALATLLISKDVTSAGRSELARRINRALNIAFFPLLIVFLAAVAFHVGEVLR